MKKRGIFCLFFLFALSSFAQSELLFLSYNIRFNNPMDGHSAWPNRKSTMIDSLRHLNGSIYCFQEVLKDQFEDLKKGLTEYESYGVGRDNGKTKGEMVPVFFKKSDWICLEKGTFWLSETPEKPCKGWDAKLPRIVSWIKLQHQSTSKILFVFNTHFDHKGAEARKQSGILLAQKAKDLAGSQAYVICGDLNLPPEHPSYQVLTQNLSDSRKVAFKVEGTDYTFAGFDLHNPPKQLHQIDYIFVSKSMIVNSYNCPDWKQDSNHWLSDHRPVFIQFHPFSNP
jgi:endonuclease/exonuclease/phosphatase family metal-dependent hydrolase